MDKYDPFSTIMYALGVAIEHEEDFKVRKQLEHLEEKLPTKIREIRKRNISEIFER